MAPVRQEQYQLGYVGDYFELVTQECLCLLFGNTPAGIFFFIFYFGKATQCCFSCHNRNKVEYSRNLKRGPGHKPGVVISVINS